MKDLSLWLVIMTVAGVLSLSIAGDAVRIVLDDNSATAATSYANRTPKYAVNGAGLTDDQHTAQGGDFVTWMSQYETGIISNQWLRIDLGAVLPLHHVKIWNFNWDHSTVDTEMRGVKDVEFYVSSSPTLPEPDFTNAVLWTLATNATVAKAPGLDTYAGEPDISLGGVAGRWLAMRPLTNHGGGGFAAISEIQVFAEIMSGWNRHMDLTLSGYNGSSTLVDFPCVLHLSEDIPGFKYSSFSSPSDGSDLRVTGIYGNTLRHEIEMWDPAGTSIVWVVVDKLKDNTKTISLHWDNPEAAMPAYATNGTSWGSSYGGVWHLNQTAAVDSTTNSNHGTAHGNIMVTGILGDGQYFDGNDYIEVADDASIGADVRQYLTVSMWVKSDVTLERTNEVHRLLEKGDCYFIAGAYSGIGGVSYLVKQGGSASAIGNGEDLSANVWHHVCATCSGSDLRIYVDGIQKGWRVFSGLIDDANLPLRIGADDSGKFFFKGILDETRIESTARSADWIKACYDSQREQSGFVEYSAVYPAPPMGTVILIQ